MSSFSDIFKSSFLENIESVSLVDMAIALAIAFGVGVFIFLIYRKTFNGVMYSSSFGVTLIALTMISTVVILAVTSNVVLSLGMVGALSIVRFRTAVKEPMDTIFMFWSLAAGILVGAGFFLIAILATLIVGALFILINSLGRFVKPRDSYLLVIRYDPEAEEQLRGKLRQLPENRVKSKRTNDLGGELVLELRLGANQMRLLDSIRHVPAVREVNLVSNHNDL